MVGLNAPDGEITCGRDQFAVEKIGRVSQGIVVRIGLPAGFQQAYLVFKTGLSELLDGFFCLHVVAVEGEVLFHQFLHPDFQQGNLFRSDMGVVGLFHMAEISVGNGVLYVEITARQDVAGGLVQ